MTQQRRPEVKTAIWVAVIVMIVGLTVMALSMWPQQWLTKRDPLVYGTRDALRNLGGALLSGALVAVVIFYFEERLEERRSDHSTDLAKQQLDFEERLAKQQQRHFLLTQLAVIRDLAAINLSGHDLQGATLSQRDLTGAILTDADLTDTNLTRANLTYANLTRANLNGANLNGAKLNGANLTRADLHGANLMDADLRDADLRYADVHGANLTYADLTGANLLGAKLTGAKTAGTIWPNGFEPPHQAT